MNPHSFILKKVYIYNAQNFSFQHGISQDIIHFTLNVLDQVLGFKDFPMDWDSRVDQHLDIVSF